MARQKNKAPVQMRVLTEAEIKFSEKNLEGINKQKKYFGYMKEYSQLMLDKGVDEEFVKKEAELRKEFDEAEEGSFTKLKAWLLLDKGLAINAEREKKKFKEQIKEIEQQLYALDFQEKTIKDQLKNGVVVKNGFRKTHNSK